jgi:hypothetical protein
MERRCAVRSDVPISVITGVVVVATDGTVE